MTREEALKEIKSWDFLEGKEIEAIQTLIPELKESEDERIRKELKEAFEAYDIESKWNGIPIRSIFAWLEKQKIFSKNGEGCYYYHADGSYTFIGSMGFGPIEDIKLNGERPKIENNSVDLPGACLCVEKQKENPKSADSIPSDCTSDAKCEDRWHKVADSMPDNPREVLCEDEAGNYFIGRYYTGEGWEISNYDDEDKPHHLNPPVSKWIDFPSEKQNEQKPMYNLEIPAGDVAPAEEDGPFDEDEFLENELSAFLQNYDKEYDDDAAVSDVARHFYEIGKKQNEQKPVEPSDDELQRHQDELYDFKVFAAKQAKEHHISFVHDFEWNNFCAELLCFIKSLRPSWKPSEEQMEALRRAVNKLAKTNVADSVRLSIMYDNLKKL